MILVLGAGELGMAVLRALAPRSVKAGVAVSVLLRPSTISYPDARKRAEVAELRALGMNLVPGEIAAASMRS